MQQINIIFESRGLAAESRAESYELWVVVGSVPQDPDEDDYQFRPIQERDSSGQFRENSKYVICGICHEWFQQVINGRDTVHVSSFATLAECLEVGKRLHDVGCLAGLEVKLFDTCDL